MLSRERWNAVRRPDLCAVLLVLSALASLLVLVGILAVLPSSLVVPMLRPERMLMTAHLPVDRNMLHCDSGARTSDARSCMWLGEPDAPVFSAVIVVWSPARWSNIASTVRLLVAYPWIGEIVLWNNNIEHHLDAARFTPWLYNSTSNAHDDATLFAEALGRVPIRVVNAPVNSITRARYLACADARFEHCVTLDDDWRPIGLRALRASYIHDRGVGIHVLTNSVTRVHDKLFRFVNPDTGARFGFAWVGVTSMFSRARATMFLELFDAAMVARPDLAWLAGYEDIFFTLMYQRDFPVVMEAHVIEYEKDSRVHALSAANGYEQFEWRAYLATQQLAIEMQDVIASAQSSLPAPRPGAQLRVAAHRTAPYFLISTIDTPLPVTLSRHPIATQDYVRTIEYSRFLKNSFSNLIDDDPFTCFHDVYGLQPIDFLGLQFAWPVAVDAVDIRFRMSKFFHMATLDCMEFCVSPDSDVVDHIATDPYNHVGVCHPLSSFQHTLVRKPSSDGEIHFSLRIELDGMPIMAFFMRSIFVKGICKDIYYSPISGSPILCDITPLFPRSRHYDELLVTANEIVRSAAWGDLPIPMPAERLGGDKSVVALRPRRRLVIGITTVTDSYEFRAAARNTWMRMLRAHTDVEARFLLGPLTLQPLRVRAEAERYGDMVFMPHEVNYSTLLNRTLEFFEWALASYDTDMVMKVNDDTYLHVDNLMNLLRSYRGRERMLYLGHFFRDQTVYHSPRYKNYEPNLPELDVYPPYASGAGFVVGANALWTAILSPKARATMRQLRNEDAAIGLALQQQPSGAVLFHHCAQMHPWPDALFGHNMVYVHGICPYHFDTLYSLELLCSGCEVRLENYDECISY